MVLFKVIFHGNLFINYLKFENAFNLLICEYSLLISALLKRVINVWSYHCTVKLLLTGIIEKINNNAFITRFCLVHAKKNPEKLVSTDSRP